jgi:hypothetical protein
MKTATKTKPVEVASPSPFAERHRLRSEVSACRVARDTAAGQLRRLEDERKQADADAFAAEMELINEPDATAARDQAVERLHGLDAAKPQYERARAAADQLLQILTGKLALLHQDHFEQFAREAEAATAGAETELNKLREQASRCAESWAKASSLWRPLAKPLRERLESLNATEGQYPDTVGQSIVRAFPLDLQFLKSIAPRPSGIDRLSRAERKR